MVKTFNINISGRLFVINEDAFSLLNDYLQTLRTAFSHVAEGNELVNDIENRIAEIFSDFNSGYPHIITVSDVEDIISRIGSVEELMECEEIEPVSNNSDNENVETTVPPCTPNKTEIKARLFRDPQNCMLGGVCSGIAHYLKTDPTWIRLFFVAAAFFSFSTFTLVYIILWIVVPEARTPFQRMQMMGQTPTINNIGRSVTDFFKQSKTKEYPIETENIYYNAPSEKEISAQPNNSIAGKIALIFGWIAKILLYIAVAFTIPVVIAMSIALVTVIIVLITCGTAWLVKINEIGNAIFEQSIGMPINDPILTCLFAIGGLLVIGLPLLAFCLLPFMNGNKNMKKRKIYRTLGIIWLISIIFASTCAVIAKFKEYSPKKTVEKNVEINILEEDNDSIVMLNDVASDHDE